LLKLTPTGAVYAQGCAFCCRARNDAIAQARQCCANLFAQLNAAQVAGSLISQIVGAPI